MPKPPFRSADDCPYRSDDIRVKAMGIEVEASGRIVVLTVVALAALLISGWLAYRNESAHEAMWRAFEMQTCVLTLNEAERKEFRTEGKYCPGAARIRFRDDGRHERSQSKQIDHL
jgi:hypothetical protein